MRRNDRGAHGLEFDEVIAIPPIPVDAPRAARQALELKRKIDEAGGVAAARAAAVRVILDASEGDPPSDGSSAEVRQRGAAEDRCCRCCAARAASRRLRAASGFRRSRSRSGRDLFVRGGAQALAEGARRGPSEREVELERRLERVTGALWSGARGPAASASRGAAAVPFRSWSRSARARGSPCTGSASWRGSRAPAPTGGGVKARPPLEIRRPPCPGSRFSGSGRESSDRRGRGPCWP
jgi:hypothetical protein